MASTLDGSLLALVSRAGPGPLDGSVHRAVLGHGAWVDVRPGWLGGADALCNRLRGTVPWQAERHQTCDLVVDVPRLLCFYNEGQPLPDPALTEARDALNAYYGPELGEPLCTAGLYLYRDGRDSGAWHGDTIGRGSAEDTVVAIVSMGAPRALLLRPRHGGPTVHHDLGHGDLFVMGGTFQRTWEHAVPRVTRATGPWISVHFRPRGVR